MIEILFLYKHKEFNFKLKEPKKIKDVCEEFAIKESLNINDLIFIYKSEKISLETELYIEEQFDLEKRKKKELKF